MRKLFQYELFLDHPYLNGPSVAGRPEINLKEYKTIWEILRLDKDKEQEEEKKEVEDPTTKLPSQIGKVYLNKDEESKSDSDEDEQADESEKMDLKMKRVLEEERLQIAAFDKEHLVPKQKTKQTRCLPLAPKNKAKQKEAEKKEKMLEENTEERFLKTGQT